MRHIRYYSTNDKNKDELNKEENKKKGFFSSMSKTTKYILLILLVLFIVLIIYLIYRSSKTSVTSTQKYNSVLKGEDILSNSGGVSERDIDIASNASYNEVMSTASVSEAGTIDDIIINEGKTGMPVGNLRYIYFWVRICIRRMKNKKNKKIKK